MTTKPVATNSQKEIDGEFFFYKKQGLKNVDILETDTDNNQYHSSQG